MTQQMNNNQWIYSYLFVLNEFNLQLINEETPQVVQW